MIPPRSSSRLASARHNAPMKRSESTDSRRRGSDDTNSTVSVTSSPSDYSSRESSTSSATSVSSSPSETTLPLKPRGGLSLRKVEEMGSGEPLRDGFNTRFFRTAPKEDERREFQRRIDLALSEVEKLALEESDVEGDDDGEGVLGPVLIA